VIRLVKDSQTESMAELHAAARASAEAIREGTLASARQLVEGSLGDYRAEVRRALEGELTTLRENVATAMQSDHDQLKRGFSHGLQVRSVSLAWLCRVAVRACVCVFRRACCRVPSRLPPKHRLWRRRTCGSAFHTVRARKGVEGLSTSPFSLSSSRL